ncbi:MAG: ion transporter [Euryarchaeota archaeon]|nr:ion transporter [Euryarchaeota archaeon]
MVRSEASKPNESGHNDELKHRVYAIFQPTSIDAAKIGTVQRRDASTASRVRLFLIALIWLLVIVVILASYNDIYERYRTLFNVVFAFAVAVFTVELLLRLWSCTIDPRFSDPIKGRLKCLFTTSLLVNLIVVVPFYAKPFFPGAEVLINAVIMLVILKLLTYSTVFNFVTDILKAKKNELFTALTIDVILLITFASFMYIIERASNPRGFSSIPASAWWASQTLTSLGYGDLVPTTALGQLLAIFAMFLGIATFAIPIAIIGAGFTEAFHARRSEQQQSTDPCKLLIDVAKLKEQGIISEEEFSAKKKELLERL